MSVEALRWAKQQKPKNATQRAVLMALADYANDDGLGWPSQKTLAADMLLTDRTIRSALSGLEAAGLIVRISKRNPDGTRGVDRIQLCLTEEAREKAVARIQRKRVPVAQPAENSSKTTGNIFRNQRKSTTEPPEAVSGQEPSQGNHHKRNGSEAIASGKAAVAALPTEVSIVDRYWFEGKLILVEAGNSEKLAGDILGKWLSVYRDHARILAALHEAKQTRSQNLIPLVVAILKTFEGPSRASPRGRRSGMVSVLMGDYGNLLQ